MFTGEAPATCPHLCFQLLRFLGKETREPRGSLVTAGCFWTEAAWCEHLLRSSKLPETTARVRLPRFCRTESHPKSTQVKTRAYTFKPNLAGTRASPGKTSVPFRA